MKVLLVRADGVGDALICAPLVAALRDAGHTLGAVLGKGNRDAFSRKTFAHVHELDRVPWPKHGSTPASRTKVLAELKAANYDIALIASEEIEAYQLAKDAGIRRRVGFSNGWEKPLKTLQIGRLLTESILRPASAKLAKEHEVATIFRLGAELHREAEPTRDLNRLYPLVLDASVRKNTFVAVQVSAKNEGAGLDRETYVALAKSLRQSRYDVMLLGDELTLLNGVAREAGVMADPLLSFDGWKQRIAEARALVTPDSGAAHVAGMLGVPTIDCFPGGPHVAENIARWSPWAAPHRSLVLASAPPEFMAGALVGELFDLLATVERRPRA